MLVMGLPFYVSHSNIDEKAREVAAGTVGQTMPGLKCDASPC